MYVAQFALVVHYIFARFPVGLVLAAREFVWVVVPAIPVVLYPSGTAWQAFGSDPCTLQGVGLVVARLCC